MTNAETGLHTGGFRAEQHQRRGFLRFLREPGSRVAKDLEEVEPSLAKESVDALADEGINDDRALDAAIEFTDLSFIGLFILKWARRPTLRAAFQHGMRLIMYWDCLTRID